MSELTTLKPQASTLPAAFAGVKPAAAFQGQQIESGADGIDGSYGILKYAGKTFALQLQGQSKPFIRKDDGSARGSVDVVFVRSAQHKAKTYYEKFVPGSKDKPLCWSNDGAKPDPQVPNPPSKVCASCPKNVFGSKITDEGKQSKLCGDHKRTAVVIDPQLALETFGAPVEEPVLLRIPAASLNDFAIYSQSMEHQGFVLPSLVTRISFDIAKNFPKLKFEALRPLTEDEGIVAMALRDGPTAIRIIAESPVVTDDEPEVTGAGNGQVLTTQTATQTPTAVTNTAALPQEPSNVVSLAARPTPQQQAVAMAEKAVDGEILPPEKPTNFDADLDAEINKLLG